MKLIDTVTKSIYLVLFTSLLISPPSSASRVNPTSYSYSSIKGFNVVRDFGAKNDGKTDSTQAFLHAWKTACASSVPSEIYVPNGNYILRPIIFEGSCKTGILFRIDGTLYAHNNLYGNDHWIVFHKVDGLHIKGGVLDAMGKNIWDCKAAGGNCPRGAMSISFDNSKNIIVDGLTSRNSQMFHITINACRNMNMGGLRVIADGNSPNTDGIHIERSEGITIKHSWFMTGDDCVSIGPNNQNIWIEKVFCGPGHGISIGSLGRESDDGVLVQNVTVKSVTLTGTTNGLRIKTFASSARGIVKNIYFLGVTMINVHNPIIIDQNYCPGGNCNSGEGSNIQISNVVYKNIYGISLSPEVVNFDCSPRKHCYGLNLQNVKLSYHSGVSNCEQKNAHWMVQGFMQPSKCLA